MEKNEAARQQRLTLTLLPFSWVVTDVLGLYFLETPEDSSDVETLFRHAGFNTLPFSMTYNIMEKLVLWVIFSWKGSK